MENLFDYSRKNMLITAHGGYNNGIITFNSMMGFETALKAGAQIIELDVAKSAEGKLYVFHPGTEKKMLGKDCDVRKMTNSEIEGLRNAASGLPIPSLDDVFEAFKGRCYINTDKAYSCFPELVSTIRRHGIEEQIILKGEVKNIEVYDMTEELAPDIPFLAVSYEVDTAMDVCKNRNSNYVGSEVVFANEDVPVTSEEYIESMHKNRKVIWVNSLLFNLKRPLVAGHDDNCSMLGDPDNGWGWLADKGYDIIQTDWVSDCINYLKSSGKYYR